MLHSWLFIPNAPAVPDDSRKKTNTVIAVPTTVSNENGKTNVNMKHRPISILMSIGTNSENIT